MFTYQSTSFDARGFLLVLCAAILAGIRVTLIQILTQKESIGLSNPVDVIYHLQPVMIIVTAVAFSAVEGQRFAFSRNFLGASQDEHERPAFASLVLVGGAVLAFGLAFFEYLLLSHTSALTFSVAAIFKEVLLMASDPFFEGTAYSKLNIVGIVICLLGILVHVLTKAKQVEADRALQPSEIRKDWENKRVKNRRKRKSRTGQESLELSDLNHADDDDDDVVVFTSFRQRTAMSS
jgi:solute carrier family 35 protein C2